MFFPARYVERCADAVENGTVPVEQAAKQVMTFMSMNHRLAKHLAIPAPETESQLELYRAIIRASLGSQRTRDLISQIVSVYS